MLYVENSSHKISSQKLHSIIFSRKLSIHATTTSMTGFNFIKVRDSNDENRLESF